MFMLLRAILFLFNSHLTLFPGKSHLFYYYLPIPKFYLYPGPLLRVADLLSGHIHLGLKLNMTKTQNWTYHDFYSYPNLFFHSLFILINGTREWNKILGIVIDSPLFPWFDLGLVLAVWLWKPSWLHSVSPDASYHCPSSTFSISCSNYSKIFLLGSSQNLLVL